MGRWSRSRLRVSSYPAILSAARCGGARLARADRDARLAGRASGRRLGDRRPASVGITIGGRVRRHTRAITPRANASPGSRSATLVSAQLRKPSSVRPALACVAERFGDGDTAGRDGEDEPVAVLAGQLHRARAEARDVERDLRLEAEMGRMRSW